MYHRRNSKPARAAPPPLARTSAGVFAELAKKTKFMDPVLAQSWPQLAGERIATLCRPGRIIGARDGKTLELHVANGSAAAEIQMQADQIIARVNGFLGPGAVARIALIQSGRAASRAASKAPPGAATAPNEPDSALGAALSSFRAAIKRRNGGK